MNIYLFTFLDCKVNDIFSIRFESKKNAKSAREWFINHYENCVLILAENISNYPEYNFEFED